VLEAMDKMSRPAQATEGTVSIPARREAVNATFSIRFNCSTVEVQKKGKEIHWTEMGCSTNSKILERGLGYMDIQWQQGKSEK
jgi:hypothetical protein